LALAERLPVPAIVADDVARQRLADWLENPGTDVGLAARGLDTDAALALLAEPADALAARTNRPEWTIVLDEALAATGRRQPVPTGESDDALSLLPALAPFLAAVGDRLDLRTSGLPASCVDVAAVRTAVLDHLGRRLARIAARTLVVELAAARTAGRLSGGTTEDRFDDFVRNIADGELAAILGRYPVLARLLAQAGQYAVASNTELLDRFVADRAEIVDTLLAGRDPGRLVGLELGAGDSHQRGRAVAVLRFASADAVVYKPRSVALQAHFAELVAWLNTVVDGLGLGTAHTLPKAGYGWVTLVEHLPCAELSDVDRFYHRQGALLALLYAVDGTDFHHENLIACVDQPVLVDVETLCHPTLPPIPLTGPDPAIRALVSGIGRTALLPTMMLGEHGAVDVSGVGGGGQGTSPNDAVRWQDAGTDRMRLVRRAVPTTGRGTNRPTLPGHDVDPADHESALQAGFRAGYDAIATHRDDLIGLLARCADDEVRIIARHTATYVELLDESTHPDLLRDGLDREGVFDLLWTDAVDELHLRIVPHEVADLWSGDVPMFTTRPGSADVWTSAGQRLPGLLAESGLAAVTAKLRRMGEVDRQDQDWLIAATLASRERTADHRSGPSVPEPVRSAPPDPQRVLTLACELADDLVARAVHDDGRANWLGLELLDGKHWTVLPLGAGLADGYCGTALFLAQLGKLTGLSRYPELARKAVAPLPRLLDLLAADPELAGEVGCGAFGGLGGLCYALARLSTLLADGDMVRWLAAAVPLVVAADDGRGSGLATGRAGGLATLLAVHAETGMPAALRSALILADRLAADWDGPVDRKSGLLFGAAADGWALSRAAAVTGSERYAAAGRAALRHDTGLTGARHDIGWCGGLAGAVLARIDTEVDNQAVTVLGEHRPLRDTSLCHGELGVAEALIELAARGDEWAAGYRDRGAGLLVGALEQFGPRCGTPRGVPSPGLLTGLAGIGYGLLRLGFADHVPSVLLLDPAMPDQYRVS
jgi:type 2 lantibiotic biosynthesis protein LanM